MARCTVDEVDEVLRSCNSHTELQAMIHQQPTRPETHLYVVTSKFSHHKNLTFHVAAH